MSCLYEFRKRSNVITQILEEIDALPDLSVDNIIKKIASKIKNRYKAGKTWSNIAKNWKDAGFDVNYKWFNDKALLHYAAEGGCERVIDALIKNGANIEVEDKERNTPLHYAAVNDHIEVAKALIDKGADINKVNNNGSTPLYYAVKNGHIEVAKVLINKGAEVNVVNILGCTPLFFAIKNNLVEIAKILIDKGADVDETGEQDISPIIDMARCRRTPLHLAAKKGQVEIVKVLIDKGADINKGDRDGRTPLHLAAGRGHVEIVEDLIDKGADVNVEDNDRFTPLYHAVTKNRIDVYESMVNHIAKLEAAGSAISPKNLQLRAQIMPKIEKRIFLHNHKPLIGVLAERYGHDFHTMKFTDIKTFFQEYKDDIILELRGIEKHLIDFVDFKDIIKVHPPRLELCAFAEAIKNEIINESNNQQPSSSSNAAPRSEKRTIVTASTLAVGIAVGAYCLIAAAIIYYCNEPSKSLENINVQGVFGNHK